MTLPASSSMTAQPLCAGTSDIAPPAASNVLHGVVLRPPSPRWDGSAYTGPRLARINTTPALQVPGVVDVVVQNNFIGVVASQAQQALHARAQLQAEWTVPVAPASKDAAQLPDPQPSSPPRAVAAGSGGDTSGDGSITRGMVRSYTWRENAAHAAAWAIAWYSGENLTIWAACTGVEHLRSEIAQLCRLSPHAVRIIPSGQQGVDGSDAAVDAALLSRYASKPVRVQDEPTGENTYARLTFSVTPDSNACSARVNDYPLRRPSMAALLCGIVHQYPSDLTVQPGYQAPSPTYFHYPDHAALQTTHTGLSATAQVFAAESFFDELCRERGLDPVQARLDIIPDEAGRDLVRSVSTRAGWNPPSAPKQAGAGRGFAYAHVIDQSDGPPRHTWSAWVADVAVDPRTGAIDLTRLTVGHHTDESAPPVSPTPKIEESIRDAAQQLLKASNSFDTWGGESDRNTTGTALDIPTVDIAPNATSLNATLAWSRSAELPAAAAIANAIYDATGVRFREPPFNADNLHAQPNAPKASGRKKTYALLGGIAATVGGLLVSALPWRSAIAPVANIDTSVYSQSAISRGRLVATAGDCLVCHTASGGQPNAGGRALETPFGTVYSTNITPDPETGIGTWSYAAFERAMRQGIHRDGRQLYPAFPYTAFAKISDADMQSLYAYLMTQPATRHEPQRTELAFPFSVRPLMAGWNMLFHRNEPYQPDPDQSTLWNRGAYLVQGAGHCAACHSPRNALGAEKSGKNQFLAGGFVDGWEAPPLNTLSKAPIAWTENDLFQYLRTGFSSLHGVAAGPMAPVVEGLAQLPESDVRAIAHYLSTLNPAPVSDTTPALQAALLEDASRSNETAMTLPGESLFEGACAVCHDARGGPPLFGSRPSLALNSNLHSDSPDNVIQVLMHGIADPALNTMGYMPGFKDSMNDEQMVRLVEYMRFRFAPDKAAWGDVPAKVREIREMGPH